MKRLDRLLIFSYGVIGYMLLAFIWWSVLLHNKNQDAFNAKVELLRLGMVAERMYEDEASFRESVSFVNLSQSYKRQELMIIGETIVFAVIMIIGIVLINRGYKKEVQLAKQQQNFLLSITHELKSPLASIKLILQTLVKRDLDVPQTKLWAGKAIKESDRLNQLVNDLLLAARLESSYLLQKTKLDLIEVVHYCSQNILDSNENVSINIQSPEDIIEINADRAAIITAINNLLGNAIKYSESNADINIDISKEAGFVSLKIKDKGPGIPTVEKEQVFKKFYRVGNEEIRKTKGTGLGLYIVKSIVEGHQGTIKIKDNAPKGTIFTIELPA